MAENKLTISISPEAIIKENNTTHDVIDKDIITITNYNIRNRKFESTNPFYITKNNIYLLEVLVVNAPGENSNERKAFVTGSLKLPTDSDLIHYIFWNNNNWITAGFDYEKDLLFCNYSLIFL